MTRNKFNLGDKVIKKSDIVKKAIGEREFYPKVLEITKMRVNYNKKIIYGFQYDGFKTEEEEIILENELENFKLKIIENLRGEHNDI